MDFAGPIGGLMAICFGMGCTAGYGFAIKTAYKNAKQRMLEMAKDAHEAHQECERRIDGLEQELRELRDILMGKRPLPKHIKLERQTPHEMQQLLDTLDDKVKAQPSR